MGDNSPLDTTTCLPNSNSTRDADIPTTLPRPTIWAMAVVYLIRRPTVTHPLSTPTPMPVRARDSLSQLIKWVSMLNCCIHWRAVDDGQLGLDRLYFSNSNFSSSIRIQYNRSFF